MKRLIYLTMLLAASCSYAPKEFGKKTYLDLYGFEVGEKLSDSEKTARSFYGVEDVDSATAEGGLFQKRYTIPYVVEITTLSSPKEHYIVSVKTKSETGERGCESAIETLNIKGLTRVKRDEKSDKLEGMRTIVLLDSFSTNRGRVIITPFQTIRGVRYLVTTQITNDCYAHYVGL